MSLATAIIARAEARPEAVALVYGKERITYRDLVRAAEGARTTLDGLGLRPDESVAVRAEKSPQAIALLLACLLAGRPVLVPAADAAPKLLARLYPAARCRYEVTTSAPPRRLADPAPGTAVPRSTAFLLTTSGSTGTPKIVPLGIEAISRFAGWAATAFGITEDSVVLAYAPLNFDLSLLDVWTTLAAGGRVILVIRDRAIQGPGLADLLLRHDVTLVQAVPMFFGLLGEHDGFPSVRHVISTGDRLPAATLARLPALFPRARRFNLYGCTETNDTFLHEIDPGHDPARPMPIGAPVPGVTALVTDADGAVLDGPGTGELWVSSPFQTTGYLGVGARPDRFITRPGHPGLVFFRTGDHVERRPDGVLVLLGRLDLQVKVRGVRLDLQGIEHVLLDHPDIVEAAVTALPDALAGHELHALVRRAGGSAVNSLALRRHCASALPPAAMPRTLRITDDPLPRTSTGKVDRSAAGRRPPGS